MSYGNKLKAWRKARGLTQKQFGKMIGLSPQFVSQHERETGPPSENFLQKSADLMETTMEELVGGVLPDASLKESEESRSKADKSVHPVEVQQFQTALEVVLGRLTEEQTASLTADMLKHSAPSERGLPLGVRQLIVATVMKAGERRQKQSIPKN